MDKEQKFVTKYYRHGRLDLKKAYRATLDKIGRKPRLDVRWIAAAAVIVILLVGGAITLHRSLTTAGMVLTAGNQNREVVLADGTRITLAPHSTIAYDDDCREVELTGKAYFEIHHDDSHPFIIHDADYIIRDIGTKLVVDEKQMSEGQKTTCVYVVDGSVSLTAAQSSNGVIVAKNEMYQISSGAVKPTKTVRGLTANDMTAWATHTFHFDNTPLPQVLSDLSGYYHVNLSCTAAEGKRLTADFRTNSLDSIKNMIEETLNVKIKQK